MKRSVNIARFKALMEQATLDTRKRQNAADVLNAAVALAKLAAHIAIILAAA